jgi:membrane protein YqaA with SNARE-associated domain
MILNLNFPFIEVYSKKSVFMKLSAFFKKMALEYGPAGLFLMAFLDASSLLTPVTTVFTILILTRISDRYACIFSVLAGTFAGALAGWLMGHFVLISGENWLTVALQKLMSQGNGFSVELYYDLRGVLQKYHYFIFIAGTFTPIPYGMFSLTAGMVNISLPGFLFATLLSHSIKYTGIVLLSDTGNKIGLRVFKRAGQRIVRLRM